MFDFNKICYDLITKIYGIIYGISIGCFLIYDHYRVQSQDKTIYLVAAFSLFFISLMFLMEMLYKSHNIGFPELINRKDRLPLERRTEVIYFEMASTAVLSSFLSYLFFGLRDISVFFHPNGASWSAIFMVWNLLIAIKLLVLARWFASTERREYNSQCTSVTDKVSM